MGALGEVLALFSICFPLWSVQESDPGRRNGAETRSEVPIAEAEFTHGEVSRARTGERDCYRDQAPSDSLARSEGGRRNPTPESTVSDLPITAYIFNSAHVSYRDLIKAEMLTAGIFQKVAIKITWVAGLTERNVDNSRIDEKWNPANLLLRIRESSTIRGKGVRPEAMGFCLSMKKNEAVVLFDRIQNQGALLNVNSAIPLGLTMAHEMGHLLLQSPTHSLAGVMKARWMAEDLTAAESGTLRFTEEEGRFMRRRVMRTETQNVCDGDRWPITAPSGSRVRPMERESADQASAPELSPRTVRPEAKLVVRLYDYAQVPRKVLTRAEEETASVFQIAGIQLSWVECDPSSVNKKRFLDCEHLNDPQHFYVNIIPQRMATGFRWPGKFATSFGTYAVVFQHQVEETAAQDFFSTALILGYVMAHELGHLLLGRSHGSAIMTDTFVRRDFVRAEKGDLVFTPQQAEQMRARILKSS